MGNPLKGAYHPFDPSQGLYFPVSAIILEIILNFTTVLFLICGQRVEGQMEGWRLDCAFVLLKALGALGDNFLDRSEQRKAKPLDTLMARRPQRLIYTDCKWG